MKENETRIGNPYSITKIGGTYRPGAYVVRTMQGKKTKGNKTGKIA